MTTDEKRAAIEMKCVEANPEIGRSGYPEGLAARTVRLADVLIAAGYDDLSDDRKTGEIVGIVVMWNCWEDDLEKQDAVAIDYLYDSLCP